MGVYLNVMGSDGCTIKSQFTLFTIVISVNSQSLYRIWQFSHQDEVDEGLPIGYDSQRVAGDEYAPDSDQI